MTIADECQRIRKGEMTSTVIFLTLFDNDMRELSSQGQRKET